MPLKSNKIMIFHYLQVLLPALGLNSKIFIANIHTHPEASNHLKECALSVTRSTYPASGTAVDQTIEQTINRHAKSEGGVIGFSRNLQVYDCWVLTRHERALYVAAAFGEAGMDDDGYDRRKDFRKAYIYKGLKHVEKTIETICNFTNPFEILENNSLICLSSGMRVPQDTAETMVKIDKLGSIQYEEFIKKRLDKKDTAIHAPIKKNKLKTFLVLKKSVIKNKSIKEVKITAQRNVYAQLFMLAQGNDFDYEKLFAYPLGPVPWPLATGDGMLAKTNKAVILNKLKKSAQTVQILKDDRYILDGNVLLHSLLQSDTFRELARHVFHCLPLVSEQHFVTDSYKEISIKEPERLCRWTSDPIIINGPLSKVPRNFQIFLLNGENKKNLLALIRNEWSTDTYAESLQNRKIYFVCDEECTLLTSEDGYSTDARPVFEIFSSQEEADTRLILHLKYVDDTSQAERVIVRSTDTDVFLLLLHFIPQFTHLQDVKFDTGLGDKRVWIDIKSLHQSMSKDLISSLLGFHAFTGCDSTSSFVRKGKWKPLRFLTRA